MSYPKVLRRKKHAAGRERLALILFDKATVWYWHTPKQTGAQFSSMDLLLLAEMTLCLKEPFTHRTKAGELVDMFFLEVMYSELGMVPELRRNL